MAERRFKRGRARRRSLHRLLSAKGWLVLSALVVLIVATLICVGARGFKSPLGFLNAHRHGHAAADAQGGQALVGAGAL